MFFFHHVSATFNVVDIMTKPHLYDLSDNMSFWKEGPSFLKTNELIPAFVYNSSKIQTPEVGSLALSIINEKQYNLRFPKSFNFSNIKKLIGSVVIVLKGIL